MALGHQSLSAKSRNSRVSDTQVFCYSSEGFSFCQSVASELTLGKFRFASKFHALGNRNLSTFIRTSRDTLTFVFR